jgi:hypothetical protein
MWWKIKKKWVTAYKKTLKNAGSLHLFTFKTPIIFIKKN